MARLNRVSLFALAGGVAILAAVASAPQAQAVTAVPVCFSGASATGSIVNSNTTPIVGGFSYNFSICNTTGGVERVGQLIVDWELPYFAEAGITNIRSPEGWTYAIETVGVANPLTGWAGVAEWQTPGDAWKAFFDAEFGGEANNPFNTNTLVLHWYTPIVCDEEGEVCDYAFPIFPENVQGGFGFDSPIGPGAAPYQASFADAPVRTGDPDFPAAGIPIPTGDPDPIPVPGTLALFGAALLGGLGLRRRK